MEASLRRRRTTVDVARGMGEDLHLQDVRDRTHPNGSVSFSLGEMLHAELSARANQAEARHPLSNLMAPAYRSPPPASGSSNS